MALPRNPDGTIRAANRAPMLTPRFLIRRWIEQEVWKQRLLGLEYAQIAMAIVRAARREIQPAVPLPQVEFPLNFTISVVTIARAYKRMMKAVPAEAAAELRKEDNLKTDAIWLSLQSGLLKGDAYTADVAIRVLDHKAKINGYTAPKQVQLDGNLNVSQNGEEDGEPGESREFQLEVLRAMTEDERRIVEEIMDRARERARDVMASRNAKPARLA